MTVIEDYPIITKFKETDPKKLEKEMKEFFLTGNKGKLIASNYLGNNTFVFFFRGEI